MSPDTPSIHVIGSGHLGRWLSESIRSTTGHRVADTMSVRGMIDDASEKSDFFTRRQALIDRILEILAK